MTSLHLFGLRLPINGNVVGAPVATGVTTGFWKTELDAAARLLTLKAWLYLADHQTLAAQLDLRVEPNSAGDWVLRTGDQPQVQARRPVFQLLRGGKAANPYPGNFNGGKPMEFRVGPFSIDRSSFAPGLVRESSGLRVSFQGVDSVVLSGTGLPLFIACGEGGACLDLSNLSVDLAPAFLACTTCATLWVPNPGLPAELLRRSWSSQTLRSMLDGGMREEVRFESSHGAPELPLSVDILHRGAALSPDNPVLAAQSIAGNLGLVLSRATDSDPIRLNDIWIEPGPSGAVRLAAHFLAVPGGAASEWTIAGRVPLHLRLGQTGRPSSFLLAPTATALRARANGRQTVHGPVFGAEFGLSGDAALVCRHVETAGGSDPNIDPAIVSEMTVPFLLDDHSPSVNHTKPGQTYRVKGAGAAQAEVLTLRFAGSQLGLPLVPASQLTPYPALGTVAFAELDAIARSALGPQALEASRHETLLEEYGPAARAEPLAVHELFGDPSGVAPAPGASTSALALRLEAHRIVRSYGDLVQVAHDVDPANAIDYVLLFANGAVLHGGFDCAVGLSAYKVSLAGTPTGAGEGANRLLGVMKLSTAFTLPAIFEREQGRIAKEADWNWRGFLRDKLQDGALLSPGWLGLLLLNAPIKISNKVLNGMLPAELTLSYLAITPQKQPTAAPSISARLQVDVPEAKPTTSATTAEEFAFRLQHLNMVWQDSILVTFRCEARFSVYSIFGAAHAPTTEPDVRIVGSFDEATQTFRFLGELPTERNLFPGSTGFGPIGRVWVRSAEVSETNGVARLQLDGRIETRPFTAFGINWFAGASASEVSFKRLGLQLPTAEDCDWKWLQIDYPSLHMNIDGPQFKLLDILEMKMVGLGVDWAANGVPSVDWGGLFDVFPGSGFEIAKPAFNLTVRIELMRLPELVARSLEKLRFDLTIGINLNPWEESRMRVALSAVDFEGLNLELLRFLSVRAKKVSLEAVDVLYAGAARRVPRLNFSDVSIEILGTKLVSDLSLMIFALPDGRSCFVGYANQPLKSTWLNIHWVLLGQNIAVPASVPEELLAVRPVRDNAGMGTQLKTIWDQQPNGFVPQSPDSGHGEWIFAAGFDVLSGFLIGKFFFQDRTYYGLALEGELFKQWFGWDFAISVLYIAGPQPEQDRFVVSMRVPSVTLPSFHFFGGVVQLDVDLRGRFMLDMGFPRMRADGSRDWERTFGAIVTPFQGTGGGYIGVGMSRAVSTIDPSVQIVSGGVAVQFGFGGAYGDATFHVWATAGVYFIAEGSFYIKDRQLIGAELNGAAGILVRAGGELNWWIISVRVEITVSAECQLTATWGWPQVPGERNGLNLQASFLLYAHASASACIGSGWFKLCRDIHVTLPMRYDVRAKLAA